jgi:peptidoglycan hydrolase CwlO-like protein
MKKTIFIAIMMIFTLSATTTFAAKNDLKATTPVATENKLSTEELSQMKNRVEEIRNMDKSEMTVSEKRELRKESKGIKENVRKSGEVIYISGGTLLLIILIIVLI